MYTLKLSQQETQIIVNALGELPLKMALPVFGVLQKQIEEQDKASAIPIEQISAAL